MSEPVIERIKILALKPGDVLVVEYDPNYTNAEEVDKVLRKVLPKDCRYILSMKYAMAFTAIRHIDNG